MSDTIEFYIAGVQPQPIASVRSSMRLEVGECVSIRGETFRVKAVAFALDYSDMPMSERNLRCNVDLVKDSP